MREEVRILCSNQKKMHGQVATMHAQPLILIIVSFFPSFNLRTLKFIIKLVCQFVFFTSSIHIINHPFTRSRIDAVLRMMVFQTTLYSIWKERNSRRHGGVSVTTEKLS